MKRRNLSRRGFSRLGKYTQLLVVPDARESETNSSSPEADSKMIIRAGGSTSYLFMFSLISLLILTEHHCRPHIEQ